MKTTNTNIGHIFAHRPGVNATGSNLYIAGSAVFSYGTHFAICARIGEHIFINDDTYGPTTSKHQSQVLRCLTPQQSREAYHVPEFDSSDIAEIRDIMRKKIKLKNSRLYRVLTDKILMLVDDSTRRAPGGYPLHEITVKVRRYEATLNLLCCAQRLKYPLPALPENFDGMTKKERAPIVLDFMAGKYKEARKKAKSDLENIIFKIRDTCERVTEYIEAGNCAHYRLANTKRELLRLNNRVHVLQRDIEKCDETLKAKRATVNTKNKAEILSVLRASSGVVRKIEEITDKQSAREWLRIYYSGGDNRLELDACIHNATPTEYVERLDELAPGFAAKFKKEERRREYENARTMVRIAAHNCEREKQALSEAIPAINSAGHYDDIKRQHSDVQCYIGRVYRAYQIVNDLDIKTPAKLHLLKNAPTIPASYIAADNRADELLEEKKAKQAEREAKLIDDWINGKTDQKPTYSAGAFARIKGDTVETSHYASVPLAHALRLVKLYDRVLQKGEHYIKRDGTGFRVGHFQVNEIKPNGAITIGCHDFSAKEAHRMAGILRAINEKQKSEAV